MLKAIATYFSVTVDDLLSGEELLTVAEEDCRQNEGQFRDPVFGLLLSAGLVLLYAAFCRRGK